MIPPLESPGNGAMNEFRNEFRPSQIINCFCGTLLYTSDTEWRMKSPDKTIFFFCLGIGDRLVKHGNLGNGRILIMSYRLSHSDPKVVYAWSVRTFLTKYPVYAITKLDDTRLIYSCGNTLGVITFTIQSERGHWSL